MSRPARSLNQSINLLSASVGLIYHVAVLRGGGLLRRKDGGSSPERLKKKKRKRYEDPLLCMWFEMVKFPFQK